MTDINLVDLIFLGLIMLLGEEDKDYLNHYRPAEEWALISWIHRN
jgi:hypothetical protein